MKMSKTIWIVSSNALLLCLISMLFLQQASLTQAALINGRFPYYIVEELPALTPIGNIAVDSKLAEKHPPDVFRKLTFRFQSSASGDNNKNDLFVINATSGVIKTAVKIDRDAICQNQVTCYIPLDVIVEPQQYYQVIQIVVDILDINDHSPFFSRESFDLKVSEATSFGAILEVPMAVDTDSQQYAIKSYEISPKTNFFKLHVNKDKNGLIVDLRLQVTTQLDHEVADVYQIKLVAKDGGDPERMGYALINIVVTDVNDNVPAFDSRKYEVFVSESIAVDSVIAKVTATDADGGVFGLVTYRFSPTTHRLYSSVFDINTITGHIFIRGSLDYEITPSYELEVLASNEGSPDVVGSASVLVRVVDTNDWTPIINIDTTYDDGKARVKENTIAGQPVAFLAVTDNDGGINGQTGCVMENIYFAVAKIDRGSFKVVTTEIPLDRESTHSITTQITCFDYGDPPNEVTEKLVVIVEDENDNRPQFTQGQYQAEVTENNKPNSQVILISATDSDTGTNSHILYTVEPKYKTIFGIDQTTGMITTRLSLDREQVQTLRFKVYAQDMGEPSKTATSTVVVSVLDTNDSPPVFEQQSYAFGVYENEAADSYVGTVAAHDNDLQPGNIFYYEIESKQDNDSLTPFVINRTDGKIRNTILLDREENPAYYFSVLAVNEHYPPMTATASVTVYIADRNDHKPVILWPAYNDNTVSVPINIPTGTKITEIVAKDSDLGDNSKLHYTLEKDSVFSSYFSVHHSTGAVTVVKPLKDINNREYINLIITVSDGGEISKSSHTSLDIYLNASASYSVQFTETYNSTPTPRGKNNGEVRNQSESTTNSGNLLYVDNNTAIIASLTSLGLLLLFVIVLILILLRRISDNKTVLCYNSRKNPIYKNNNISESKERCFSSREDQC